MTDVGIVPICEDTRIRDSDWNEISWPISRFAGSASLRGRY